MYLAPRLALDPVGDFGASPQTAISRRLIESLLKLRLREDERPARITATPVAQTLGTLLIVAMSKGADPCRAVAGDQSDLFGRLALREQPDDLPVARAPPGLWPCGNASGRSEERRVGKECRSRWS